MIIGEKWGKLADGGRWLFYETDVEYEQRMFVFGLATWNISAGLINSWIGTPGACERPRTTLVGMLGGSVEHLYRV